MTKRTLYIITAILVLVVFSAGCSSEAKKPTESSTRAQEAFAWADRMALSYINRDMDAMESLSTFSGFDQVKNSIKPFDKAALKLIPRWVEIKDDVVTANFHWEGVWQAGGEINKERGMAVFELKGTPLRLNAILSGNPFAYPD